MKKPVKPKSAKSPYMCFKAARDKSEHKDVISAAWKALSAEDKLPFEKQSTEDHIRVGNEMPIFEKEMEKYDALKKEAEEKAKAAAEAESSSESESDTGAEGEEETPVSASAVASNSRATVKKNKSMKGGGMTGIYRQIMIDAGKSVPRVPIIFILLIIFKHLLIFAACRCFLLSWRGRPRERHRQDV